MKWIWGILWVLVLGCGWAGWSADESARPAAPVAPASYAAQQVRQAVENGLARGGRIEIVAQGETIVLSGIMGSKDEIERVVREAREKAGSYRVVNRLRVGTVEKDRLFVNGRSQTPLIPVATPVPNSFIEGTVYDAHSKKALSDVEIWHESMEIGRYGETKTDAQGHYRLGVDSGASYYLSASVEGYSPRRFDELKVNAGGLKHDIFLQRRAVVKGMVRDATGRPLSGATLYLWNQFDSTDQVESDRNGNFRSEGLAVSFATGKAKLNVAAVHPKFSYVIKEVTASAANEVSDEVTLDLKLPALATVSGRITSGGKPLKGAYFSVVPSDGGLHLDYDLYEGQRGNFFTDANGRYRFQLSAPRRYSFSVNADDMSSQEVVISLWPGQNATINRDLKPFPYGTIAGRVTDLSGRPVFNAGIELWTRDTSETNPIAYTDKKGFYRYDKVAPRDDYDVVAYMPQSQMRTGPRKNNVRIRSHQTTRVNFRGDVVAPQLRMVSPASGAHVSGMVNFRVRASDNDALDVAVLNLGNEWLESVKISKRERAANGRLPRAQRVRSREVALPWDSRKVPNGRYTLRIDVYDLDGNLSGRKVNVWVKNGQQIKRPGASQSSRGY